MNLIWNVFALGQEVARIVVERKKMKCNMGCKYILIKIVLLTVES